MLSDTDSHTMPILRKNNRNKLLYDSIGKFGRQQINGRWPGDDPPDWVFCDPLNTMVMLIFISNTEFWNFHSFSGITAHIFQCNRDMNNSVRLISVCTFWLCSNWDYTVYVFLMRQKIRIWGLDLSIYCLYFWINC